MSKSQSINNSENSGKPPVWLQSAGIVAGIISTLVITLGALAAVIHFTIRADITPQLAAVQQDITILKTNQAAIIKRIDTVDQRLERIEAAVTRR